MKPVQEMENLVWRTIPEGGSAAHVPPEGATLVVKLNSLKPTAPLRVTARNKTINK